MYLYMQISSPNHFQLKLLVEVPRMVLYYSLIHPSIESPLSLELAQTHHYPALNVVNLISWNKDGEIQTRDYLVIKVLIPCQKN